MASLLENISPACYKQMYNDRWLILPTPNYLRRLSSALNVDLELSDSTLSYMKSRFSRLAGIDKTVSILSQQYQYCRNSINIVARGSNTRMESFMEWRMGILQVMYFVLC